MTKREVRVMVCKAIFNYISIISWVSFIGGGNQIPPQKPTDHSQTLLYRVDLVWTELELNVIVVLDTHYI
jgi:hypothetical protein